MPVHTACNLLIRRPHRLSRAASDKRQWRSGNEQPPMHDLLGVDQREQDESDDDDNDAARREFHEAIKCLLLNGDVHFAMLVIGHVSVL